ncbi:hypothetical protein HF521_005546 [Silurus meridionalis]|uniref:C2H2-type domain-containing protein n=1 Tax=Silurus meridionalis TaxID=175797 RepID=A0A8T0AWQ9_SILME|nr:hypothetical protein HF521_005546 [Silurus meridionalis]
MPRVFLVKKTNTTSGKRNWNEVPDCVYTPVCFFTPHGHEECEHSPAELPVCSSTSQSKTTHAHTPSLSSNAQLLCSAIQESDSHSSAFICSKNKKGNIENKALTGLQMTPESPFSCPICHKTFSLSRVMKRHLRTHSDLKRYSCEYCGKASMTLLTSRGMCALIQVSGPLSALCVRRLSLSAAPWRLTKKRCMVSSNSMPTRNAGTSCMCVKSVA